MTRVRRAGRDDWQGIAALHCASWRTAYRGIYPDSYLDADAPAERRRYWHDALAAMDPEQEAVFLAEEDGSALGFGCVRRADGSAPFLDNLHVRPDRKGQGIGALLLRAVAAWVEEAEPGAALELGVWADNRAARAFYARLGGREVALSDQPIPGGGTAPQVQVRWARAAELLAGRA